MDAFAEIASLPILTYDSMDVESNRCLGAAIWMLDQMPEQSLGQGQTTSLFTFGVVYSTQ